MPFTVRIHGKDVTRQFGPIDDTNSVLKSGEGTRADIMPKITELIEEYGRIGNGESQYTKKYINDMYPWHEPTYNEAVENMTKYIEEAIYVYSTLLYEIKDNYPHDDYEISIYYIN